MISDEGFVAVRADDVTLGLNCRTGDFIDDIQGLR